MNSQRLFARLREMRAQAAIRDRELKHLGYASGVWSRLARLLSLSRCAWAISENDAEMLISRGFTPHPVGLELQPPRRIFVIPEQSLPALTDSRQIRLQASVELLASPEIVLVPFTGLDAGF